jgi:hypothetical protein
MPLAHPSLLSLRGGTAPKKNRDNEKSEVIRTWKKTHASLPKK